MKRLTEQNYYELLEVSPRASFEEVQSAYDQAVSIYSGDSLATYSLLTQEERHQVLIRLADAYRTLTSGELRGEYDQLLIKEGELSPHEIGPYPAGGPAEGEDKLKEVTVESLTSENESEGPEQTHGSTLDMFDGYTSVTGKSIRKARLDRNTSLEEVYRKTNVPKKTLQAIEEEDFEKLPALVYLKGFLKAYADILKVDQAQMVDGYVKRFLEWRTTDRK